MQSGWSSLSHAQRRIWFLDQLDPGAAAYNIPRAMRITGAVRVDVLHHALNQVVNRHEPLRAVFGNVDGEPLQAIKSRLEIELPVIDVAGESSEQRLQNARELAAQEGARAFDLATGPLVRFSLLRLDEQEHVLMVTMHHIVTDGWSMSVFFAEVAAFYEARILGWTPRMRPLPMHYGDHVRMEDERLAADGFQSSLQFWQQNLQDAPPILELPADRPRPALLTHRGQTLRFSIAAATAGAVKQFCRERGVTPFMLLLAVFDALLWRYTGVGDIVVGSAAAGRTEPELEPLIGLFVNTIVLRTRLADNPTFLQLLECVKNQTLDALAHQDVPFEIVVQALQPTRSMDNTPVFQVMFLMQNMPKSTLRLPDLEVEELEFDSGLAKFDLTLEVFEADGLYCTLEYNSDIFDRARIERLATHFETLLGSCLQSPLERIADLKMLAAPERELLLNRWNATCAAYPHQATVHALFEAQAARTPQATALTARGTRTTFAQLDASANQLAHHLMALGAKHGDAIGICMERSPQTVIAWLAVMKTGGVLVPVDPSYPESRVRLMLEDSGARILLTQRAVLDRVPGFSGRASLVDREWPAIAQLPAVSPEIPMDSNDAAYVIYTSGSTGTPKGVVGTHKATVNRFAWMYRKYPFQPGEICAQKTSLSFVDAIWETFGPLTGGATLHIISEDEAKDSELLVRELAAAQVTRLVIVPSLLRSILDVAACSAELGQLRFIVSSGEALPLELFNRCRRQLPHARLINLYGSSEVAGDVTCFDPTDAQPRGSVPIGRPISNTHVYIVDERLQLLPVGVPGELLVGGDGLGRGYWNHEELTAERFIPDPFRDHGGRVFRTGDLARYRDDGQIEYLGRQDRQVKIRGIRIELAEVEFTLSQHESVQQSVVLVRGTAGHERLIAFVVPASGQTVVPSVLRRWLRNKLPEYLIPSNFVSVESIPLSPNGKVDHHALPAERTDEAERPYLAPRNETERRISEFWVAMLGVPRAGVYDHFFELGGHSLLGTQVISRIRRTFQVEIPLRTLFEEPTVAALASAVQKAQASGRTIRTPLVAKRPAISTREKLAARLKDLSDDEVEALLRSVIAERSKASGDDSAR